MQRWSVVNEVQNGVQSTLIAATGHTNGISHHHLCVLMSEPLSNRFISTGR